MRTSEIVERLLETDALTGNDEGTPTHYTVHADDLEYLVDTLRSIISDVLREHFGFDPVNVED